MDYYFTIALTCNFELVWGKMCYKGVAKLKHKVWLVSQYNVSATVMGQTPPKGLFMVKRSIVLKTCAIQGGMCP